jgi:hypothetical protein
MIGSGASECACVPGVGVNDRGVLPRRRLAAILGVVIGAWLMMHAGIARAAITHEFLGQITEVPAVGPAPEEDAVPLPGRLVRPEGLAVDSGRLYAAEHVSGTSSYRVDVFDTASDEFLLQFPQVAGLQSFGSLGLAVGRSTGETQVYVGADTSEGECEGRIAVFDGSGKALAQWTGAATPLGAFGCAGAVGVAADNSASLRWASGDVYVADRAEGKVDVYKPQPGGAEPVSVEAQLEAEPGVPFEFKEEEQAIAVDEHTGNLLVADHRGGVVDIFRPAALVGQFERVGEITGSPAGPFTNVNALATDGGTGDIYVHGTRERIEQFDESGNFLGALKGTPSSVFEGVLAIAVDAEAHRVFVGESKAEAVDVFGPSIVVPDTATEAATGVSSGGATLNGIVNPAGLSVSDCHFDYGTTTSYGQTAPCAQSSVEIGAGSSPVPVSAVVSDLTPGVVYHFRLAASNANGENVGSDRLVGPPTLDAVSSSAVAQTTATLNAQVNPDGVDTTYRFEYGTSATYGTAIPVPDADIGAGEVDEALSAELTGLQAGVTYHYRIVTINAAGTVASADETFSTEPPATISAVSSSDETPTTALLHAQINPLGNDTKYHFDYGTSTAYGASVPVPDADAGSGFLPVTVSAKLEGLSPDTTYHYRVVAENSLGIVSSSDHTFVYSQNGSGTLPDGRAYEMITPPQKNGALIGDVTFGPPPEIAEDGSRVILGAVQCFGGSTSCVGVRVSTGSAYSFGRSSGAWTTTPLAPSAEQFEANTWSLFNADMDTALFTMPTPPNGADHFYARNSDGSFGDIGPLSPEPSPALLKEVLGANKAATADLSHLAIAPTFRPIWSFDPTEAGSVYEFSGTGNPEPRLVGVRGGAGSSDLISACATELGGSINELPFGEMSADGRTIFFTAEGINPTSNQPCPSGPQPPVRELFARVDNSESDARTVAISQPSAISPTPVNHECTSTACVENTTNTARFRDAQFVGAAADGSQVFFTDTQQLTDSASQDSNPADTATGTGCSETSAGDSGCNLYTYVSPREDPPGGRNLVDVSAGSAAGGPRVQGVMAFSSDGSHVYFVARGVLTGAANDEGHSARDGEENLYAFTRDDEHPQGSVQFIATLPESDSGEWTSGPGKPANVTPDGRFLVFTSGARLTPDDTRTDAAKQVFRYDAETGGLVRISIGEDGFNDNGNAGLGDASIVAGKNGYTRLGAGRGDPTMSHDGSYVFFMSSVALTPGAIDSVRLGTNGNGSPAYAQNVYEYHDEQVSLISDGRDTSAVPSELCEGFSAVCLIGTDATGANAFFATADQLVPQDTDTQIDFYDARICTSSDPCNAPPPPLPPPCLGEACHGTPPAPLASVNPGSASFSGAGNIVEPIAVAPKKKTAAQLKAEALAKALKACRSKREKAKRTRCEVQARRRYGTHKAKKKARTRAGSQSPKAKSKSGKGGK